LIIYIIFSNIALGAVAEAGEYLASKPRADDRGSAREPLAFHDDADQERPPVMIWSLDWKTVKITIKAWVSEWYERSSSPVQR
jgi:hypothetical protein